MPLYDFQCNTCGSITEDFYKIADCPDERECSCGGKQAKIISGGAIERDEPVWLNDQVRGVLQDPADRPIESRCDYKRFMRDHPEIVPVG